MLWPLGGVAFVQPPSRPGALLWSIAAGPLVKVEAVAEWGDPVHIEMSQERFRDLQLIKDEAVFVIPKDVKVFANHEA